jgi:hypothetical protein
MRETFFGETGLFLVGEVRPYRGGERKGYPFEQNEHFAETVRAAVAIKSMVNQRRGAASTRATRCKGILQATLERGEGI